MKPLVKWAGGKRSIMNQILPHFPNEFENYHEPFAGGLSVFAALYNDTRLHGKTCYLSDIMAPLMNVYVTVQTRPEELIAELRDEKYANSADNFALCRERFNALKGSDSLGGADEVELAALFLYLNRTCFNGMYRENSRGLFNVPFGRQSNPTVCNDQLIMEAHRVFAGDSPRVTFWSRNFLDSESRMLPGDLVYMDPPYHDTFTAYTKSTFGEVEQQQVRAMMDRLTTRGCKVIVSNSDTPFVRDLYRSYRVIDISVKRVINSKASERKTVKSELLIVNY